MAGKQKLVSLLHLIAAYKDETEYTVLAHVITVMFFLLEKSFVVYLEFFPLSYLNYFALQTSLNIAEMMAVAAPEELGNLKKFLIDFLEPFTQ